VESIPTQIVSGIITATSLVMKQGFSEGVYLKAIELIKHTLLFSRRKDLTAMVGLTENPSYFAKKSLNNFLKFIPDELLEESEKSNMSADDETREQLEEILTRAYPYIVFS